MLNGHHLFKPSQPVREASIIIPILLMQKLRLRQIKWLVSWRPQRIQSCVSKNLPTTHP